MMYRHVHSTPPNAFTAAGSQILFAFPWEWIWMNASFQIRLAGVNMNVTFRSLKGNVDVSGSEFAVDNSLADQRIFMKYYDMIWLYMRVYIYAIWTIWIYSFIRYMFYMTMNIVFMLLSAFLNCLSPTIAMMWMVNGFQGTTANVACCCDVAICGRVETIDGIMQKLRTWGIGGWIWSMCMKGCAIFNYSQVLHNFTASSEPMQRCQLSNLCILSLWRMNCL